MNVGIQLFNLGGGFPVRLVFLRRAAVFLRALIGHPLVHIDGGQLCADLGHELAGLRDL